MELFGFKFGNKKQDLPDEDGVPPSTSADLKSFVEPNADDGAQVVNEGGTFGAYLDFEAGAKSEGDLITRYREMSMNADVDGAIDDIVNEFVSYDDNEQMVEINLDDVELGAEAKKKITNEFNVLLQLFEFQVKGYDIVRQWYIDGRINYHAVIDTKNPQKGIMELRLIDPRKLRKIREMEKTNSPVQKVKEEYFLFSELGFGKQSTPGVTQTSITGLKIPVDSIISATSGLMDPTGKMVISYLHKAYKPLNQLRTLEDATLIYFLSRAPERRIFYIDTGNLPKMKAEQHVRDMMTRHKNKLVYDAATGEIKDERKFMTMLEDFWLPRRSDGKGTEITALQGGTQLQQLTENLDYFAKKLMKSLNVPPSRLQSDATFNMGRSSEISRDELKFAKFINRLRARFSVLFIEALRRQLVLKGIMSYAETKRYLPKVRFDFMFDNHFTELRDLEILGERVSKINDMNAAALIGKYWSHETIRKKVLKQSEFEIEEEDKLIKAEKESGQYEDMALNGVPNPEGEPEQPPMPGDMGGAPTEAEDGTMDARAMAPIGAGGAKFDDGTEEIKDSVKESRNEEVLAQLKSLHESISNGTTKAK